MFLKRLIALHIIRIRRRGGEQGFQKVEQSFNTDKGFVDAVQESLPTCFQGHVIRDPQESGGLCCICGETLCKECAQLRCQLDGYVLCRADALVSPLGHVACSTHSVSETIHIFN